MRINRNYVLAGSAWLVLVVVGAVLVWAVISRVGQGVVTQPGPSIVEAAPFTSPPRSERPRQPRSNNPSSPRPSASASPGAPTTSGPPGPRSPEGTPTSGPSPSPPTGPGPGPGSSPAPNNPPPSSSPPPPQSPQDQGVRRSWQGAAGVVTVECRGATISLQGAQPNSGWSIEIDDRGPDEVRVEFETNDGDRRTRVRSECVGGTPRFQVDRDD